MDFLPLSLVLASAVSHGLWNYLAKEGKDKESFMLLLNLTSLPLLLPVFLLILSERARAACWPHFHRFSSAMQVCLLSGASIP